MPLTIAHAAAVLPFKKCCPRFLSFAALIAGSMAPDLTYPFHLFQLSAYAHSFTAYFLINLPAGVLLLMIYFFSKNLVASQLPSPHREFWTVQSITLNDATKANSLLAPIAVSSLFCSLLIGSATHIIWDSFTHQHGFAVEAIPLLQQNFLLSQKIDFKVYKFLQYFSSVTGLIIICIFYSRQIAASNIASIPDARRKVDERKFFKLVACSVLLATPLTVFQAVNAVGQTFAHLGFVFIVNSMVMLPATLVVSGLIDRLITRQGDRPR